MKITAKLLSIPPYVSVAWKDISTLHSKTDSTGQLILVITLRNLTQIEVPHMDKPALEEIFHAFSHHHDQETPLENKLLGGNPFQFTLPLKQGSSNDVISSSMSHNAGQADLPNLPPDILEKITQIAKIFGLEDTNLLPRAEPHCNCLHCQVMRSLQGELPITSDSAASTEEEVSLEELTFKQSDEKWDVKQVAEKLYTVTNLLDANEHYNVFLGNPLGCTCGNKKCVHIHAVLST